MLNAFEEIEKEIREEERLSIAKQLIGLLTDEELLKKREFRLNNLIS